LTNGNLILGRISFAAAALFLSAPAQAHFFWSEITPDAPTTYRITFGEEAGDKLDDKLVARAQRVQAWTADGKDLPLTLTDGFLTATIPAGTNVVPSGCTWGIRRSQDGSKSYLLEYYSKAALGEAGASATANLPVEVFVRRDGTKFIATVKHNNTPVPNSEIVFTSPASKDEQTVKTDANGSADLGPAKGGRYDIRAKVEEARSGFFNGKPYPSVADYSTLSFVADSK